VATLLENEQELQATLTEAFPTFNWSVGTAFYSQIIQPWAVNLSSRDDAIDTVKNNMSLIQVLNSDNPDAELTALLLSNYNIAPREGTVATGFMSVYFSGAGSVTISTGTTITCGDTAFVPQKTFIGVVGTITEQDTEEVSYIQATLIGENEYVFVIEVDSVEATTAILGPGQVCTSDLSSSFISSIVTASTFSGGVLTETTAELLERAKLGITTSSNTGKDNIRSLVEASEFNVLDSQVFGFGDASMLRDSHNNAGISTGGRADVYVATDSVIQKVITPITATRLSGTLWEAVIPSSLYAGAYGVDAVYDGSVSLIDTPLEHVLSFFTDNTRPFVDTAVEARYSKYQQLSVRFYDSATLDTIETEKVYSFRVLYLPNIDDLQTYVEDPDIQASMADILVKAFVPIEVSIGVTIDYSQGITAPDAAALQTAVSSAVNGRRAGSSLMPASDVVYAVKNAFPEGIVRMPISMQGKIYLPDGTVGYSSDNDNISVPSGIEGVDPGNTKFFASPDLVSITLNEV
jgi:hypothetical protein